METKNPNIELDHIGLAVGSHSEALKFWQILGWSPKPNPEIVAKEKVSVSMLELQNDCRLELLEPTDPESTIQKFIQKKGPGIHHICLKVQELDAMVASLSKNGVKLIGNQPFVGAGGHRVIFVHPSSTGGVLVELSEKGKGE